MNHRSINRWNLPKSLPYEAKLGAYLFLIYGFVYAGFILINLTRPLLMETILFANINFATVYGLGLILLALVMALVYNFKCAKKESQRHGRSK